MLAAMAGAALVWHNGCARHESGAGKPRLTRAYAGHRINMLTRHPYAAPLRGTLTRHPYADRHDFWDPSRAFPYADPLRAPLTRDPYARPLRATLERDPYAIWWNH